MTVAEKLRNENDNLREQIAATESNNLALEQKAKDVASSIETLKAKVKLLMDKQHHGNKIINDVVSETEIEDIRKQLNEYHSKHHIQRGPDEFSKKKPHVQVIAKSSARKQKSDNPRPPIVSEEAEGSSAPTAQTETTEAAAQRIRDSLRGATSSAEVSKVIDEAKALNMSHEVHLGEKLLGNLKE